MFATFASTLDFFQYEFKGIISRASSSDVCWGLRARSTELLRFILSHHIDLICIQKSNLNLSFSFQIPEFFALRFDGTHSRSGIFSIDVTDASDSVIIFVRQGLSFSELSTSSLSSLDPCSDYVEVNISLYDSSSLSFLNVYAHSIRFSPKNIRTNFFSPSILFSYVEAEAVEFSHFRVHFRFNRKRTASTSLVSISSPSLLITIICPRFFVSIIRYDLENMMITILCTRIVKVHKTH